MPNQKKERTRKKISWFTLVELIVVVTILSILSTIWFVSYSWYLSWVRDTTRISTLWELEKSLNLYSTNKSLPLPDEKRTEIKSWSETIAYQWYAWKTVIETIKYSKDWKDPKDKIHYTYYVTKNKKYFQLLTHLE
jgi:prepilin-type N-terminal cleavage/methylation domain-containing protein